MISDGALHRFNKDVLYREGKKNCVRSYDEEQKLIGTKIRPPASSWGRHFFVKTTKKFFCIKTLQECRWLLLPPALRLLLLLYWPFTLQSPFLIRYRYLSLSLSLSLFWNFLSVSIPLNQFHFTYIVQLLSTRQIALKSLCMFHIVHPCIAMRLPI